MANFTVLETLSSSNVFSSVGFTKSRAFAVKSCQNISSSEGFTKSRAFAAKSCQNISSSAGFCQLNLSEDLGRGSTLSKASRSKLRVQKWKILLY